MFICKDVLFVCLDDDSDIGSKTGLSGTLYTNLDLYEITLTTTTIISAKDIIASPITIADEIRARKLDQQFENTADPINGTQPVLALDP